jgi:EAL domain-containing protein (putative c-di-GMP-specific phosphodiesterase class I)
VRWHPTKGLLGPDVFIGLAEQTDLIVALGRWVLREACETALEWPSDILLSVNLSPAQFALSDVVEDVREALIQTRFPASRLELEITENVMLVDTDGALATMNALKQLGVRLNMDDFGTGYSSRLPARLPVRRDQDRQALHRLDQQRRQRSRRGPGDHRPG